jgi:hypothetical protein
VQLLHPDKNQNKPEKVRIKAEEELKQVNQAYNFLKQPINNPFRSPPKVHVSPKHIRFKDMEKEQKKTTTFIISSIGGPYTNIWIDNEPASWLSVLSVKSLTNEQLPLEVTIEARGVEDSGGKCSCNLIIKIENKKTKLASEGKVWVEVYGKEEPAIMECDTGSLSCSPTDVKETYESTILLSNVGGGSLVGRISFDKLWLNVHPQIINIRPSANKVYTVKIIPSLLPRNMKDYGEISITSNGGELVIPVDVSDGKTLRSFSWHKFFSTFGNFIIYPFGFFFITIPLLIFLSQYTILFYFVLILYTAIALAVATKNGYKE